MQPEFSSMRLIRMSCQRPSVMSITYAVRTFFFLDSWILLCGNSETTQSLELERKQIWSCWDAQSHCWLSNFETYPLTPCSVACSWGICTSLHKSPWKPDRNHPMRQTIHDNPTIWALYGHCLPSWFLIRFLISKSMGTVRYSKICPCWLMMLFRSAPCRASDPETNDAYPANKLISAGIVKAFTHLWQKRNSPMPFTKAWSFHKTVSLPLIHYWPPFTYHLGTRGLVEPILGWVNIEIYWT